MHRNVISFFLIFILLISFLRLSLFPSTVTPTSLLNNMNLLYFQIKTFIWIHVYVYINYYIIYISKIDLIIVLNVEINIDQTVSSFVNYNLSYLTFIFLCTYECKKYLRLFTGLIYNKIKQTFKKLKKKKSGKITSRNLHTRFISGWDPSCAFFFRQHRMLFLFLFFEHD